MNDDKMLTDDERELIRKMRSLSPDQYNKLLQALDEVEKLLSLRCIK